MMANEKRLIDANALNAVIRGIAKNIKRPSAVELMCLCQIAEQPTVDAVEVVHGRWERMVGMMPPEYHGRHECSCCGVKALDWKFHEELSNYCPNCGAKMDGDKNE